MPSTHPRTSHWPGSFGIFAQSRAAARRSLAPIAIVLVAQIILAAGAYFLPSNTVTAAQIILEIAVALISGFIAAMLASVCLNSVRGSHIAIGQAIRTAYGLWWPMIALMLMYQALVILGLALLVVPGVYIAIRLCLAPYYLVDRRTRPLDALVQSWLATRGHEMKVLGIAFAMLAMLLPVLTIVGLPLSIYLILMYQPALAILYDYLLRYADE